jgi:hypothetical protein
MRGFYDAPNGNYPGARFHIFESTFFLLLGGRSTNELRERGLETLRR